MVHYGKHIIDPETGLCEICDRGAIHDFRQGKRPGKQFLYSNQDGKFTYRPNDDEPHYNHEETTPRFVRKPLYPEPPPARTRPVVHEEPIVQKKTPRRKHSPADDTQHGHPPRPTTFYYVDNTGQMLPRNEGPSDEPRRRYLVQNHYSPPTNHPTRSIERRARTPPPPASESWRAPTKRHHNSDTEIIHQPSRVQQNDVYYNHSPRKAEMYSIQRPHNENRFTTISGHVQGDTYRKQHQLEPIERKYYTESEPAIVKKVYKKLPNHRDDYPQREHIPQENHLRLVRKVEKIYPPPNTYESSPQLTNKYVRNPLPNKHPAVYYLQSTNGY